MPGIERYISRLVEMESTGSLDGRYSSQPGGHFAVIKICGGLTLNFLIVEATGKVTNGFNAYRRVDLLTFDVYDEHDMTSPELKASFDDLEDEIKTVWGLASVQPVQRAFFNRLWRKDTIFRILTLE